MFGRFENRVVLTGRVIAKTGLHIGSGGSLEPVGADNPVVRDAQGSPYIPGSSFKGVLRSRVEAILWGLNPAQDKDGMWSCNPVVEDEWCVKRERMSELREKVRQGELDDDSLTDALLKESCTVCKLFGSPWLASKVQIKDLYITGEWLDYVEVRDGVAIDRDTETAAEGRKFDFEAVPSGTTFALKIVVENTEPEELGLLFVGLREFNNGGASLGGVVSRGLGRVSVEMDQIDEIDSKDRKTFIEYLKSGEVRPKAKSRKKVKDYKKDKIDAFIQALESEVKEGAQEAAE